MSRGLFISVEGIEGAGKTTNMNFIKSVLESSGLVVEMTREPGGTPLAEEIRQLLLATRDEAVVPAAELLLMFAARVQHVEAKIKPLLSAGVCVLSDRFTDASYAYQGGGRGLDWSVIHSLERLTLNEFQPDISILLSIDAPVGMSRASSRGKLDRFEQEQLDFYERANQAYLRRVKEQPGRFLTVEATQPIAVIQEKIRAKLMEKLQ